MRNRLQLLLPLLLICGLSSRASAQSILSGVLTANGGSVGSSVATPTDSPGAGTYGSAQTVTLADSTSGSTICYTTDGSTPGAAVPGTCDSSPTQTYSVGFSVSATTTVKAIGTKALLTNSALMSSLYTITTPHAYWRINATASASSTLGLAEVGFYGSTGTYLATGGTATASSTFGSDLPALAFDSDTASLWASNVDPNATPQWIQYHFGSAVSVFSVILASNDGAGEQGPTAFTVDYSDDGAAWTTAATFTGVTWASGSGTSNQDNVKGFAVVSPASGSYVQYRLNIATAQSGAVALAEWHPKTSIGGSSVATGGLGSATDEFGSLYAPPNAFDADGASLWAAANTTMPKMLLYAFPKALHVAEFDIIARNDGGYATSPATFSLQATNNGGVTWTTINSFTAATWTTNGQVQTFVP